MAEKRKSKQIKTTRSEPENEFEILYKTMPLGVIYQDKDGKIILSNPAAEQILGLTQSELHKRTSMDSEWKYIHEDGADFPGELHPSIVALRTGKPVHNTIIGVYNPLKKNYKWILVNATPLIKRGASKPYQVYTTFNDITRLKDYELALHKSESFLENIIYQSPYPMWISDDKGTLIRINKSLLTLLNLTEDEVIGKYNIFNDNIVLEQGFLPLVKSVFEKGKTVNFILDYDTSFLRQLPLKKNSICKARCNDISSQRSERQYYKRCYSAYRYHKAA